MKTTIYDDYPDLKSDLIKVSEVIDEKLVTSENSFSKVIQNVFNENSKLVRPALCIIAASYNKKVKETAINLAAAIEMMHVASLVHDDIIDRAKTRRNQATINEEYDEGYAVICGDYLFSKSFQLIFETQDIKGISRMGSNVTTMVFGEVEQYLDKYDEQISIDRYLSIIEKKTASFFSTSLVLGANLAKIKQSEIDLLETIGKNMGILFQIQDDILDFSTEQQIGKSSKSDILRGVYSLPLIIALEKSSSLKDYLKNNKQTVDFDYIATQIIENDALNLSKEYIESYHNKTIDSINKLSNKEVSTKLTSLLNNLLNREK